MKFEHSLDSSFSFLRGKTGHDYLCEDDVFLSSESHLTALMDGVSSKSKIMFELDGAEVSGGIFASRVVKEAISEMQAGGSWRAKVDYITAYLNRRILEQYPGIDNSDRPATTLNIYDELTGEIILVGDSWAGYETSNGSVHKYRCELPPDDVMIHMRSYVNATYSLVKDENTIDDVDHGREAILDVLKMQHVHANNTESSWGYGVINGTYVDDKFITVIHPGEVKKLVFASDGYPEIVFNDKLDLAEAEKHLAQALIDDPECVAIIPATKGLRNGLVSFDDRAWCQIVFH